MARRTSSTCESFLSNDGSDDVVVRYKWNGESIGLELMRSSASSDEHLVQWGTGSLGVTLSVEETSRRIIVTRSSRIDVQVGDVLLQAGHVLLTEHNLSHEMALLKQQRERGGAPVPFVFRSPPPPVLVKKCAGALREAGVGPTFELRYVDGRVVRYLEMKELQVLIRNSHKPCTMAFVQCKGKQFYEVLQRQEHHRRKIQQVSQAAAASAGLALAAAIVVNIT
uniref:PDZ domain-containing protein n=1 Tax=Peronospora matthiolae TaxID=2874970 RepID=A0AAV1UEY2_9STRA